MSQNSIRRAALAAVFIVGSLVVAPPAHAGPPWISAEFPANPHETATRGAFFLIHTYHHGTPMQFQPTGTAEGIVNGRRQSVKLEIVATGKPGIYAVRYQPASTGVWVLAINMGSDGGAGMLVSVGKNGQVSSVQVPSRTAEDGRWVIPRTVNSQDIESALRAQTALIGAEPSGLGAGGLPRGVLLVAGLGLVLGIPLVRRLRAE